MAFLFFLALSLFLQGALGELVCEELPMEMCSFAVSSSGNRCSLETYASRDGSTKFQCRTSQVIVNNLREYIESDECISACGLDRKSVGISSDNLLVPRFAAKICSSDCSYNCPNVVDLYTNMAVAEGVSLPSLCSALRSSARRAMSQLLSSGGAASAHVSAAAGPISAGAAASISDVASPPDSIESSSHFGLAPAPL